MKALTIWQPWASLIARPMVAREVRDLIERLGDRRVAHLTGLAVAASLPILERAFREPKIFPLKHVLGTAVVGVPTLASDIYPESFPADSDRLEHSNWAWPLSAIEPLEPPVPAGGARGLWDWSGA